MMRKQGTNYFAENAIIVGDVRLAEGVNIWPNCVIRGDVAPLILGKNVNLQDGVIMHADFGFPNELEEGVVVGHGAILHGLKIGRDTLIGMGATILGGSIIGEECIIAAGALVVEGARIPPRSVVMGVPGKVVRAVTDQELANTRMLNARYLQMCQAHNQGDFPDVRTKTVS